MNKVVALTVPNEDLYYIEALDYEVNALKSLLDALEGKRLPLEEALVKAEMQGEDTGAPGKQKEINEKTRARVLKQYIAKNDEYAVAKNALQEKYMPHEWKGHQVNWRLDFDADTLYFERVCNCEIKDPESAESGAGGGNATV